MAMPNCRNRVTGVDVEESLCNAALRPEPTVVQCNTHLCPPKWIADEWSPCNKVCGTGTRDRLVVCAEESNGVKHRVPDEACRGLRPKIIENCNVHECPKWQMGTWSGVSLKIFNQNDELAALHILSMFLFLHKAETQFVKLNNSFLLTFICRGIFF